MSTPDDDFDLESLYRDHHRLVAWLVRSSVPESAVDDVIQEAFVAMYRRRAQAPADEVRKWIVGVTRSVCHSHRRGTARRLARLDAVQPPAPAPAAETVLDDRAVLRRVHDVLLQIDPAQREVFALIELEGLSAPEAAELTGEPLNTVYSRLRLARRKVASAVDAPQRVVADARRTGPQSRRDARQTWAAIAIKVGLGAPVATTATALGGASSLGWLWTTVAVGAVSGAVVLATTLGRPDPEPSSPWKDRGAAARVPASHGAPRPDDAALSSANADAADPEEEPPVVVPPPEPSRAAAANTRPAPSAPVPPPAAARAKTPAPDSDPAPAPPITTSTLAAEAELLTKATRHLDARQISQAQAALAEHARRFPDGELRDERARLLRHMDPEKNPTTP